MPTTTTPTTAPTATPPHRCRALPSGPSQASHAGHLGRLRAAADVAVTLGHVDDATLTQVVKHARRAVEDAEDGSAPGINAAAARARLAAALQEQELRAALRCSWLAVDGGCDSYTTFIAAGGLPAVVAGGGAPVGYGLAVVLDRAMFLRGCRYVLAWPDTARHGSVRSHRPLLEPAGPAPDLAAPDLAADLVGRHDVLGDDAPGSS